MIESITHHQEAIIAVIMLAVVGASIGNYACSVVYRLPKGQTPFERHPYCGSCGAALQPIDLFPIISYCLTRGKCRYCGTRIPGIYTVIELACMVIMIAGYFTFGMGEAYLVNVAAAVFIVMMAAIYWQYAFLSSFLASVIWLLLLLSGALAIGEIFAMVQRFTLVLMVSLFAHVLMLKIKGEAFHIERTTWPWWLAFIAMAMQPINWQILAVIVVGAGLLSAVKFQRLVIGVILPFLLVIMIMGMVPL